MPKYEVRLESQTDSQARIMTIDAETSEAARATAQNTELGIVQFSLLPPSEDVWEDPLRHGHDDGVVDLGLWDAYDPLFARETAGHTSHKEAFRAGYRRVANWRSRVDLSESGKVRAASLGPRSLARLLAHKQEEPYEPVDIREIKQAEIDAQQLVRLAKQLQSDPAQWQRTLDQLHAAGIPMNVVTAFLNGVPWRNQIDGSSVTVFSSATVKMSLHTGLTGVQDTDDFFNDISGTEITGTGYTAGGFTFANKTSTYDSPTDQVRLDNTVDPNWTTSTLSSTDAAVWVDTAGASSTDPIYGEIDFGATVSTTAGTMTVALDATGWCVVDLT